jgi:hypothetical protein
MDAVEKKAKKKDGFRTMPFILGDLFTLPDAGIISFFFFFLREYYYFSFQFCCGWFMINL